jgi:hypothetical protein
MTGTLLVANYQIQKKQIAKTLCENRNKPSKGCQGKCFLKKQLKKAEQAEKSLPGSVKEKMEMAYTIQEMFEFAFVPISKEEKNNTFYTFSILENPTFSDPHPPQV